MLPPLIAPAAPRTSAASPRQATPAHAGQGLVEYALLIALVSILLIPGLIFLQSKQSSLFERVGGALRGPAAESIVPGEPNPESVPDSGDDCKNGGWQSFNPPGGAFTSQGDCVSWANTNGR